MNLIACFLVVLTVSCKDDDECDDYVSGTLEDITGLSNCQWIIKLGDGSSLDPINFGEFDITPSNGKAITLSYKVRTDLFSTCMVGTIVEIECIK